MANKTKITEEFSIKIKEMASQGMNPTAMGNALGVAKDTIKKHCKDNGIQYENRKRTKTLEKEKIFKNYLSQTKTLKEAQRFAGVGYDSAVIWAKECGREDLLRTRAEASQDRRITQEQLSQRMPGHTIIGFDKKSNKYVLSDKNGVQYKKDIAHITQSNPAGKSGFVLTLDEVKKRVSDLGYEYVEGTWINTHTAFKAIHLKCGETRTARIRNFKTQDCAICTNSGTSKVEEEVKNWVISLGFDKEDVEKYKFEERITRPKEIDIFVKSLNIGIEFCGLKWHSEEYKDPDYHEAKMKSANNAGIRLITLFEDEWMGRNEQTKLRITQILKPDTQTFKDKDLESCITPNEEAIKFLNDNHISGSGVVSFAVGVRYCGVLISVMSFLRRLKENAREDSVKIHRVSFKKGFCTDDILDKMLDLGKKVAKTKGFLKIKTEADNRWEDGNMLEKRGFVCIEQESADYSYSVGWNGRIPKEMASREFLVKKGAIGEEIQDMTDSLGYVRIWDCGKKIWEIDI